MTGGLVERVGVKWEAASGLDATRTNAKSMGSLVIRSNHRGEKNGFWCLPEAYIVESKPGMHGLPPQLKPRKAWPTLVYVTEDSDPRVPEGLPFDRYEAL